MAGVLTGFGDELRLERERRGISLERLCSETKLNARHIDALERSDYRALPGGVFRRGIVRAYLACVGLTEQEWMPRFEASYAAVVESNATPKEQEQAAWATFAANVKKNRGTPQRANTARWLGVLALFLVLMGAAWAVWEYVLRGHVQRAPAAPPAVLVDPVVDAAQ